MPKLIDIFLEQHQFEEGDILTKHGAKVLNKAFSSFIIKHFGDMKIYNVEGYKIEAYARGWAVPKPTRSARCL